jgi:sugar phosphate isomerase/epimerase
MLSRRDFCRTLAAAAVSAPLAPLRAADPWALRYILSTPMYGSAPLAEFLGEIRQTGTDTIDLWPKPHGTQREQVDQMGSAAFADLLARHQLKCGASTRYDLGPFGLKDEVAFLKNLGGSLIVTGAKGPKDVAGDQARAAVKQFVEQLKPHVDWAARHGITLAIENHAGSLLSSPDSMRFFAQFAGHDHVGIAFAPHHLGDDAAMQARLIAELGPAVKFFYAQQHGRGNRVTQPLDVELLQMPGRGPLDFTPLIAALRKIGFGGWTSIYMHPFPRGRLIFPEHAQTTAQINRARHYLDDCARKANAS